MRSLDPVAARERAVQLAEQPERAILGITGAPAAGKSTYAEVLVGELVGSWRTRLPRASESGRRSSWS